VAPDSGNKIAGTRGPEGHGQTFVQPLRMVSHGLWPRSRGPAATTWIVAMPTEQIRTNSTPDQIPRGMPARRSAWSLWYKTRPRCRTGNSRSSGYFSSNRSTARTWFFPAGTGEGQEKALGDHEEVDNALASGSRRPPGNQPPGRASAEVRLLEVEENH